MIRIIVVDDEQDNALTIKVILESNGFAVDTFNRPDEALAQFRPDYYEMLITDVRMPVINGFELYRQIRKIDNKIKVVFMTAFEMYEAEFKNVSPSVDVKDFFKKPIGMSELIERVKQALGEESTMP